MSDEPKDLRIPIMMSASDVESIDDWRFASRTTSRSEAIRRLCEIALRIEQISPKSLLDAVYDLDLETYEIGDSLAEIDSAATSEDWVELATAIEDAKLRYIALQESVVRTKEKLAEHMAARGNEAVADKIKIGISDRRTPSKPE